nr:integrin alpha-D-like isoform X3 [Chrysemys picta bellii]XP_042700267.1 integrin alpha-D-like isoform X3 [Chrysemys picta bellii]XP_042700268.1 integrin alpha-D-like isoform X3 [Chrysemys picta bellii]XP_042700269.1 integrin alpha-D-like isoform X3 [Chrysemys picta bellii]XP_042700270.1 integrin alpha-D-like isoform X3 [Chrysemys picta bellii]XP_042700271.1 integrin alpha-D-like isoform X3 [Chrysemys picta bellii]
MDPLPLLIYLCTVLAPSRGFSVDVEVPITFKEAAVGFGQSVVQFGSAGAGGLLVGAPLQTGEVNETGKVYKCDPGSRRCQEIPIQRPPDAVNMSLGLSLAARDSNLLVCGPTVHRACGENMYVNGYCFLLDQSLQQLRRIPDTLAECPRRATDIALLIDGSGSIRPYDFGKMKTFLSEIMKRFRSADTQFALMQYSDEFKQHFDFSQYRRSRNPDSLVRLVEQLRGTTHTASAIRKVVRELFTSRKGARDEATKVLIVITDGEKYEDPLSYSDAVPEAERAGIIRYAIGVGQAFSSAAAQRELQEIASQPSNEHVFRVDNFDALQGIQSQLQEKIFAIEGTQSQSGSSFQLEMSQEGFSSLLSPDGPVLGAVGAYDWSGGIYLYGSSGEPSFINVSRTSTDMNDAYLGYSSQVITANGQSSYVVGAPRYQHAGKVVLFSRDTKGGEWTNRSEVFGEQIGSYFGGTLCAVDLDRDGNTDLVLIGAPMFYTPLNGGRVYNCLINWPGLQKMTLICSKTLQGQTGQAFGRFGASMSEIGDISGDGQTDVAIGAPMENDNRGALYIFHGGKGGLSPQYRQRIEGSLFPSRLHYFGQAVSGGTDLTGDGLPDIAVGAQGQILLLRSRPVLRVRVSISFQPPTIPTAAFNCQEQEQLNTKASTANVCFTVTKSTMDSLGNGISSTIHYSLSLDPGRTKIRAAFDSTGSVLSRELRLGIEKKCETYQIKLPLCPEDTLTPITLRLNYTLTGEPIAAAGRLRPILSEDSALVSAGSLPFGKDCGSDKVCTDELQISFNFSGLSTLVVGITPELTTTVSIQNRGENSYSTGVQFFYPAALSYRRVLLLQSNRRAMAVKCSSAVGSEEQTQRNSTCHINHPIFWSGAEAVFVATFDVFSEADLEYRLQITAKASSDNGGPTTERMIHRAELPVKYGIFIILTSLEESTKYVNFSTEEAGTSVPVTHRCEPELAQCASEAETPGSKDFVKQMSERPLLDCSVATCKKIRCRIASLEMQQPLEFMIKGNVSFQWVSQTQQQKVSLVSEARIEYEEKKYTQKEGFVQRQVQTVVERSEAYNYLPIIVGSSVGGLVLLALITAALYKFGFFKRQYKQRLEGEMAEPAQSDASAPLNAPKQ